MNFSELRESLFATNSDTTSFVVLGKIAFFDLKASMFSVVYVVLWLALAYVFHTKVPYTKLKIDGFVAGAVMLGFYLSFGIVGFALPEGLHKMLGLSFGPDWLMRLSQVTGAVCAFYVGLRGTVVWGILLVVGIGVAVVSWIVKLVWQFVFHGGA